MKTPTTIEALEMAIRMLDEVAARVYAHSPTVPILEMAIRMLDEIARGVHPNDAPNFFLRLQSLKAARDEHRRLEMVDERNRRQIRELSSKKRGVRL